MFDPYDDIKSRIDEKPYWYDVHGVPRYGDPPDKLKPFIRKVKCQDCHMVFRVCLVGGIYPTYGGVSFRYEPVTYKPLMMRDGVHDVPDTFKAVYVKHGEIPEQWHYGDAPDHDSPDAKPGAKGWDKHCVGVTMNSIPEYLWGTGGYEEYE